MVILLRSMIATGTQQATANAATSDPGITQGVNRAGRAGLGFSGQCRPRFACLLHASRVSFISLLCAAVVLVVLMCA